MKITTFTLCVLLSMLQFSLAAETTVYPFQNTGLSDDKRVDNLLSLMTIDEKVNALSTNLGIPRLGIRNTGHSECHAMQADLEIGAEWKEA